MATSRRRRDSGRFARRKPARAPRRRLLGMLGVLGVLGALASSGREAAAGLDAAEIESGRIVHLLGRAAFGPTPELVREVRSLGRSAWLARQIAPEAIADPDLDRRLARYPSLSMDYRDLIENYPRREPGEPQQGLGRPQRIVLENQAALLTRAVHARAQLREVMTDFWFNHFNVFAAEGAMPYLTTAYLRDAIRPRVFGRFEDLLRATAESPAMLYYLDNRLSQRARRGRGTGLNENYARELLELHTLGVEGGYGQADVVEVARAFTGWTITPPETAGPLGFLFRALWHEPGDKVVLGTVVPGGGKDEGDRILRLLAGHPSTARHLATKLVTRLVSDSPSEALIVQARDTYLATDGDLGATVLSILEAKEFYARAHRRTKVKSPLEAVASAIRAAGGEVRLGVEAARLVGDLGQGLLLSQPPTGWSEVASDIVSAGGMVSRFELAYRVASGSVEGVDVDASTWERIVAVWGAPALASYLLGRAPGPDTLAALEMARRDGASGTLLAALVLASPEFQQQ